jgi:hypothetical protein
MTKISELPAGATPDGTEKVPVLQGGATVALTAAQIGTSPVGRPFVMLVTGQSNPVHEPTFANSPNANATRWNNALGTEGSVGTAYAALPTTTINVGDKIASDVADAFTIRPVKVINISSSGQPIAQWLSGASTAGALVDVYAEIQANIAAALAAAGVTKIDAFVWWQGESDTSNASYVANFATMMTRFWTNSWFPQETPVLIFGIAPTSISGDVGSNKVNNYLQAIVGADSDKRKFVYTGALSAAGYWVDTLHMTGQGYYSAGAMASGAFLNGVGRASFQGVILDPVTGFMTIGYPVTPDARVTISGNTGLKTGAAGAAVHAAGADGTTQSFFFDAFGGSNALVSRRWDGTFDSSLAVGAALQIWSSQGYAWDGSTIASAVATFDALTVNAQSGSDHSTRYRMRLTPTGSTALAEYFSFDPGFLTIYGKTSGSVKFAVPDVAGSNTITWPAGTTNFSATGGTSQVVKQTAAGGALTVGQLAFSDISGAANLTSQATGTLPVANGGTGVTTTAAEQARMSIGMMRVSITGVNFNSANTDNVIVLQMPSDSTRFSIYRALIYHASGTLTTSTVGLYTASSAGGLALIPAATAVTVSTAADATANNGQSITGANFGTTVVAASMATPNTIYFRIQTPQGAAQTADILIDYFTMP